MSFFFNTNIKKAIKKKTLNQPVSLIECGTFPSEIFNFYCKNKLKCGALNVD